MNQEKYIGMDVHQATISVGQFPRIDPIILAAILQQGVSSRIADYQMVSAMRRKHR